MNRIIRIIYLDETLATSGVQELAKLRVPFTFDVEGRIATVKIKGRFQEVVMKYLSALHFEPQASIIHEFETEPQFANQRELKMWLNLDFGEGEIATIKAYRERKGCGLREAHDFVRSIPH